MLEVIFKHQLAGLFSSGTEVAFSTAIRSNPVNQSPAGQGDGPTAHRDKAAEEIAMRKWNAERGMSLVEATIILMVLAVLTGVIAPSAADYLNDARNVKAAEDVTAIGTGIRRLLRDTGKRCLLLDGGSTCLVANRVDLLLGSGAPAKAVEATTAYTLANAAAATAATFNWQGATGMGGGTIVQTDTIEDQLVTNTTTPYVSTNLFTSGGGPRDGLGWRGAYLTGPTGADPWGYKYQANTMFLAVARPASLTSTIAEGLLSGGWASDVLVISGGTNGVIETSFGNEGAAAGKLNASNPGGDDVIYLVQGATR